MQPKRVLRPARDIDQIVGLIAIALLLGVFVVWPVVAFMFG